MWNQNLPHIPLLQAGERICSWLERMKDITPNETMINICYLLWTMWKSRNKAIFDGTETRSGGRISPPTSVSGRGVQEALVLLRSRLQIPSSQNLEIPVVVRPPVDQFDFDEHVKVSSDPVVVLPSRSFGGVEMEAEAVADVDSVFVDKAVTVSSSSGGGGLGSSVSVFERDDEDEFVISRSAWIPPTKKRIESPEKLLELLSPAEKPLVSARFGHQKPFKVTPEGKFLFNCFITFLILTGQSQAVVVGAV
ncbi:hypothetical protein LINPERPRIM_LOCUS11495 [Linum perenne]